MAVNTTVEEGQHLLPSFIIVGPSKTATTSLYLTLNEHPEIAAPLEKEPLFFTNPDNYHQGIQWYETKFPRAIPGENKITYEASPFYFQSKIAIKRILETLGQIKIVCLLRDPVSRFMSQYKHFRALNVVNTTPEICARMCADHPWVATVTWTGSDLSVDEVIEKHDSGNGDTNGIFRSGYYYEHLTGWIDAMGAENVHYIVFDDLMSNPRSQLASLQAFLDLSICPLSLEKTNETKFWLDYCPDQSLFDFRLDQLTYLRAHYRPHNEKLFEFLGRDLGWNT